MDLAPPAISAPPPAAYRVDVAAARSSLSAGLPDWTEVSASLGRRVGPSTLLGSIQKVRRFDRDDVYLEAGWARRLGADASLGLFAGGAPNADFRPQAAVRVEAERRAGPLAWSLVANVAKFPAEWTGSLSPGLAWHGGGDRSRVGARLVLISGDQGVLAGLALDAQQQLGAKFVVRFRASDAPETSEGRVVRVRGWGGGAGWRFSDRYELRLDMTREDRGAYSRTEGAVALTGRF